MATRLQHWDNLERLAQEFLREIEKAAQDPAWGDDDVEGWGDVYEALMSRPWLSLTERSSLADILSDPHPQEAP